MPFNRFTAGTTPEQRKDNDDKVSSGATLIRDMSIESLYIKERLCVKEKAA